MKKLIIFCLLTLNIACAKKEYKSLDEAIPVYFNEESRAPKLETTEKPYEVKFSIESKDDEYNLVAVVELIEDGSHFVSPFATRDFKGKFNISIDDNPHLKLEGTFTEDPRTEEEFDPHPFVNGYVNWVRENTTYKYKLDVIKEEDFEASGLLKFVIEPRCTLEVIKFTILYKNGKMSIVEYT